jgi:Protein of unknown function (DUF1566)/Repeat of unknown function (DUF5648)
MLARPPLFRPIDSRWGAALILSLLVAACGGGQDSAGFTSAQAVDRFASTSSQPASNAAPSAATIEAQQEGARLNIAELDAIAKTGVLPKAFDGQLSSGADISVATASAKALGSVRKSAASRVPVYRFFNTRTSAHFFTTSETERANLVATQPFMTFEGPAFYASSTPVPGLSPVHRFYNRSTGVHFYTISESERAHIAATLPTFTYEGIGYYASTLPGTGYTPLYRFFYTARGFHFYTNSESEKNTIIATLPQYSYEGIGYYALGSNWQTPALPHSGITSSECFQAGSDSLVACSGAGALALNPQQDGHRNHINSMSFALRSTFYGDVPITFDSTDCVQDRVTGLHWEGKTTTGTRGYLNTYTNYGDGRGSDASTYVATVNPLLVCAFNDWRLPTVDELHGIVNYGVRGTPSITAAWFPNAMNRYWSSTSTGNGGTVSKWVSSFGGEGLFVMGKNNLTPVRLVRGAVWSGQRYLATSESYPGDGTNNAVVDRKTGLTWRRCLQGQTWNGGACIGATTIFTHEAALAHARAQARWRLPNIKEVGSVMDLGRSNPALDPTAFPGTSGEDSWSSTPLTHTLAGHAWYGSFSFGFVTAGARGSSYSIRLVLLD